MKECRVRYPRPPRKYKVEDLWRIYCNHLEENDQMRFRLEFVTGNCEGHELSRGRNVLNRVEDKADRFVEEVTLLGNIPDLLEVAYKRMSDNLVKFADEMEVRNKVLDGVLQASILSRSKAGLSEEQRLVVEGEIRELVEKLFNSQAKGAFVQWKIGKVLPNRSELFKDIKTTSDAISALSALLKGSGNDGIVSQGLDLVAKLLSLLGKGTKK